MANDSSAAIEKNIREARKAVEFGNALERLKANKDFKKVFTEGYFEQEAVRLVHLKADPAMQSVDSQKSIVSQMDAIGAVRQYLDTGLRIAALAARQISADEETLEEILAEEAQA